MIAAAFLAGLVPGVGLGVLVGRRVRLGYRELNDWLGEWAEARKGADWARDRRVISGEHPVVEAPEQYDQDADSGILCTWCPNEATGTVPYAQDPSKRLPLCGQCHDAEPYEFAADIAEQMP